MYWDAKPLNDAINKMQKIENLWVLDSKHYSTFFSKWNVILLTNLAYIREIFVKVS
jgi:hypothetical protein